ncbi:MAG TPA: response regulator [Chthoniobacteraceae bacterium]|jgi:DNA-binding response OmpR family regulator|nr:response regulator [Chthoniobacteraceae bacterium]
MKILIAEDEKISRRLLETTLAGSGFAVTVAEDGAQAWEAMQQEYFPVLITDFQMPEMDGYELSRRIREANAEQYTYVILLTAQGSKADYFGAISAGVDDFLMKPFDEDLLAARLHVAERIVGLRQHARRLERLLPMCCYCKKIRDDASAWHDLETYLLQQGEFDFSHTYCPDCYTEMVEPQLRSLREVRS